MIGTNIKYFRTKSNLTQKELGAILGVSNQCVSAWEHDVNEPNIGMIEKMASVFKCSKADLIGWDIVNTYINNADNATINSTLNVSAGSAFSNSPVAELFGIFQDLSESQQREVVVYANFLKSKSNEKI